GRRRRRTLITGSQPLPRPLNATFGQNDMHNFPGATQSLNRILNESKGNTSFQPLASIENILMSDALGASLPMKSNSAAPVSGKSMIEQLGIQPPGGDEQKKSEQDVHKQRDKTAYVTSLADN